MDITNSVLKLDYLSWKKTINQMLLYKYFKEEAEKKNEEIKARMVPYNEISRKTAKQIEEYTELLNLLFDNSTSIYKKVLENINNQELLNELYSNKNINLTIENYNRWLETGEKIKI